MFKPDFTDKAFANRTTSKKMHMTSMFALENINNLLKNFTDNLKT